MHSSTIEGNSTQHLFSALKINDIELFLAKDLWSRPRPTMPRLIA